MPHSEIFAGPGPAKLLVGEPSQTRLFGTKCTEVHLAHVSFCGTLLVQNIQPFSQNLFPLSKLYGKRRSLPFKQIRQTARRLPFLPALVSLPAVYRPRRTHNKIHQRIKLLHRHCPCHSLQGLPFIPVYGLLPQNRRFPANRLSFLVIQTIDPLTENRIPKNFLCTARFLRQNRYGSFLVSLHLQGSCLPEGPKRQLCFLSASPPRRNVKINRGLLN